MSITYDARPETSSPTQWRETAIALLVPPLEVWRQTGWSREFWLNLALTMTSYFPGVMHAVWVSEREMASRA